MVTERTMKAFDADLQDLARMVAEMGGLSLVRLLMPLTRQMETERRE